jgi:hypothetical protein
VITEIVAAHVLNGPAHLVAEFARIPQQGALSNQKEKCESKGTGTFSIANPGNRPDVPETDPCREISKASGFSWYDQHGLF